MDEKIELISDGDGVAVIGDPGAVERFLNTLGLLVDTESDRIGTSLNLAAAGVQVGSEIAANSGRWMKLTKESAAAMKEIGLIPTKTPGLSYTTLGRSGKVAKWLVVESPGPSALLNPANLSVAAAVMSQLAMKQQMDEIADYLATIDAKVDGLIRSQTNQVLAKVDGVDLAIREAKSVRESVGRVSDVTWSKLQGSVQTIHETLGYSLRQIADVADKIEGTSKIADLMKMTQDAGGEIQKWLVVLARCFELLDAVGVLELDRVLDASPEELDRHRIGLKSARRDQLEFVLQRTHYLLDRVNAAIERANSNVLFNPIQSPAVIKASNQIISGIRELCELLGVGSDLGGSEATRWVDAASDRWGRVRESSAEGLGTVKKLGGSASEQAHSAKASLSKKLAERKSRRSGVEGDLETDV